MATPSTALRPVRHDDGLTLIEMVVAMGVLMVVMLASLTVFITAQHGQRTAEGTDRAVQLANHRIERIRQQDWRDVGFYKATYDAKTTAATKTATATTATDYATYRPAGETPVFVGSGAVPAAAADITPYEVTTSERNKYTIYTTITWGIHPSLGAPVESNSTLANTCADGTTHADCQQFYSFKRVRVTVTWNSGGTGAPHKIVNETWFAPETVDEAPPGIIVSAGP